MKKKIIALLLAVTLAAALALPACAASSLEMNAADHLYTLGLFRGTQKGFELDRGATREEAMVMIVKLLGREKTALGSDWSHPFSDVDAWADDYVGYCWQKGLVSGYDDRHFGGGDAVTGAQYLTLVLRVLGYSPAAGDFQWDYPWTLAKELGLIDDSFPCNTDEVCTRGAAALISDNALYCGLKNGGETLGEYLENVSSAPVQALTGAQIARKCSGAIFRLETFYDTDCTTQFGSASGFFISPDGVAVTNYHALDGHLGARAELITGEKYPVAGIISADPVRDLAVIKVDLTALDGSVRTKFQYLELGRSVLMEEGDAVYAIGSPLSQGNTMTAGIVSNPCRTANGDHQYIQVSAATAVGSSGGALLNDRGQVVGVTTAIFSQGDDMTLCVPIDALLQLSKTDPVRSLYDYRQEVTQAARDTVCGITAGSAEVTVRAGQAAGVVISTDCTSEFYLGAESSDGSVAVAQWGVQTGEKSCTLLIYGLAPGTASITVSFLHGYGNPDAKAVINVRVI